MEYMEMGISATVVFILTAAVTFVAEEVSCQKTKDDDNENGPYEFGFTIDGQQHRHEKKDTKGIIQGEFGFITADGIYHVTVYATDENGNFRILSMRNIRISAPLDGSPLPPGAKIESYQQITGGSAAPAQNPQPVQQTQIQTLPQTPVPAAPTKPPNSVYAFTTQPTVRPGCSGCGIPAPTTANPNGQRTPFPFQTPEFQNPPSGGSHAQAPSQPVLSNPQGSFGSVNQSPGSSGLGQVPVGNQQPPPGSYNQQPTPNLNNPQGPSGGASLVPGYPGSTFQAPSGVAQQPPIPNLSNPQGHSEGASQVPGYGGNTFQAPSGIPQQQPQQGISTNFGQQVNTPQDYESGLIAPNQPQTSYPATSGNAGVNYQSNAGPYQNTGYAPQGVNPGSPQYPGQENRPQTNVPQNNVQNLANPGLVSTQDRTVPSSGAVSGANYGAQKPPSILDEAKVVNGAIKVPGHPDIPVQDKFPGMSDGLPDGISEQNVTDILYKFHYEVGFHGHYEKGLKNGAKIGGYFVNGRDGISRIVTYIADENGYRPKVKFIRLGLDDPKTPKAETEKTFGLKSFEFVWYPIN